MTVDFFAVRGQGGVHPPIADRIDATGDCWEWLGSHDKDGYAANVWYGGEGHGRVHRFVWEALVGPIPEDKQMHHLCENKGCVNPDHLTVVTPKENTHASHLPPAAKNARKTHCPKGHPYSGENLYVAPAGDRMCRECRRQSDRDNYVSSGPLYSCTHCGRFYSDRTAQDHWICQAIEDKEAAGVQ